MGSNSAAKKSRQWKRFTFIAACCTFMFPFYFQGQMKVLSRSLRARSEESYHEQQEQQQEQEEEPQTACPLLSTKVRQPTHKFSKPKVGTNHYTAAMCAVARNESLYLDEWFTYHRSAIGFQDIYIFDNDESVIERNYSHLAHKYAQCPGIHIIPWPVRVTPQMPAYHKCLEVIRETSPRTKWVGYWDVDEFPILHKYEEETIVDVLEDVVPVPAKPTWGQTVAHYLQRFLLANRLRNYTQTPTPGALSITWNFMGDSNKTHYEPKPVTSRFRYGIKENDGVHIHVKSISLVDAISLPDNPHFAHLYTQEYPWRYQPVSPNGSWAFPGPWNYNAARDRLLINHYVWKSQEEYAVKRCHRGRADLPLDHPDHKAHCKKSDSEPGVVYNDLAWKILTRFVPEYAQQYGAL